MKHRAENADLFAIKISIVEHNIVKSNAVMNKVKICHKFHDALKSLGRKLRNYDLRKRSIYHQIHRHIICFFEVGRILF